MSQLERLVQLGVPALAGRSPEEFRRLGADLPDRPDAFLAVHPSLVSAAALTPLLSRSGKPGFVVEDMADLDRFVPLPTIEIPDRPLYLVAEPDRGDDLRNWSPDEAMPELTARGRSPLTISEGISWLLQQPDRLEANYCFMCIAETTCATGAPTKPCRPSTPWAAAHLPSARGSAGCCRNQSCSNPTTAS